MSFNNNNNNNGNGQRSNRYNNNNQNNNNGGNNNNNNQKKKHSGAKLINWTDSKGNAGHGISAWNYSNTKGMISVFIAPYSKTGEVFKAQDKNGGAEYISMMCKIDYKSSGVEKHFPVLVNTKTDRVAIPEMGWVVNPRAANGGYCGTFKKD